MWCLLIYRSVGQGGRTTSLAEEGAPPTPSQSVWEASHTRTRPLSSNLANCGRTPFTDPLMQKPWFHLGTEIDKAIVEIATTLPEFAEGDFKAEVRPADPRFGDFQANGVLPYAKQLKTNPRTLGEILLAAIQASGRFPKGEYQIELAGPGFINFKLTPTALLNWFKAYRTEDDLSEAAKDTYAGKTIVVDFSSPNTAKQMHVGHIRSTVIGEALSRLLEFCGAKVVRDNHIGDWGTQFGILIRQIKKENIDLDSLGAEAVPTLERLYKEGSNETRGSETALQEARDELVLLQNGDDTNTRIWEKTTEVSWKSFQKVYDQLGIHFDEVLGESFYRDKVERVYQELSEARIAEESQGALVVFHPEHPRFKTQPMMLRKSDGASNYATTDMATALHRVEHFGADAFIILTDARQRDHFEQIFLTFKKWMQHSGKPLPEMKHIYFGSIQGEDGKAIKTRSGEPVLLGNLFDEGIERARNIVQDKNPDLPQEEKDQIAEVVGIEAIRYADLSQNRTSDYKFQWDKLLSFEGNTAPYLLYAIARIRSIFRKLDLDPGSIQAEADATPFVTETEIALARKLLGFVNTLDLTLADMRPHVLCNYLFELSGAFSSFYNADKVMVDQPDIQARRLLLCARTLTILETGCHLLGMRTLERM